MGLLHDVPLLQIVQQFQVGVVDLAFRRFVGHDRAGVGTGFARGAFGELLHRSERHPVEYQGSFYVVRGGLLPSGQHHDAATAFEDLFGEGLDEPDGCIQLVDRARTAGAAGDQYVFAVHHGCVAALPSQNNLSRFCLVLQERTMALIWPK